MHAPYDNRKSLHDIVLVIQNVYACSVRMVGVINILPYCTLFTMSWAAKQKLEEGKWDRNSLFLNSYLVKFKS